MTEQTQKKIVEGTPQQNRKNIKKLTEQYTQPPDFSQAFSFTPSAEKAAAWKADYDRKIAERQVKRRVRRDVSVEPQAGNISAYGNPRETLIDTQTGEVVNPDQFINPSFPNVRKILEMVRGDDDCYKLKQFYDTKILDQIFKLPQALGNLGGMDKNSQTKNILKLGHQITNDDGNYIDRLGQMPAWVEMLRLKEHLFFQDNGKGSGYWRIGVKELFVDANNNCYTGAVGTVEEGTKRYVSQAIIDEDGGELRGFLLNKPAPWAAPKKFPFDDYLHRLAKDSLFGLAPCVMTQNRFSKHDHNHDGTVRTLALDFDTVKDKDGSVVAPDEVYVRIQQWLEDWSLKPELQIRTGKGFHLWFKVINVPANPGEWWESFYADTLGALLNKYGLQHDDRCKDLTRMLRLPDFAYVKGNVDEPNICTIQNLPNLQDEPGEAIDLTNFMALIADRFDLRPERKMATERAKIAKTLGTVRGLESVTGHTLQDSSDLFKNTLRDAIHSHYALEDTTGRYDRHMKTFWALRNEFDETFARDVMMPLEEVRSGSGAEAQLDQWARYTLQEGQPGVGIGTILEYLAQAHYDTTELQKLMVMDVTNALQTHLKLGFTPSVELNQKYLPSDLLTTLESQIKVVGVRSPMGSGKTEILKRLIAQCKRNAVQLVIITYRRSLQQMFAKRLGLPTWEALQAEYKKPTEDRDESIILAGGYTVCVDSFTSTMAPSGSVIVMDEAESVDSHMILAHTDIAKHRERTVTDVLNALARSCTVIMMDALLTDGTVDRYTNILGVAGDRIVKIQNTWKPENPVHIYQLNSKREGLEIAKNYIEAGKRVLIVTGSQKTDSLLGTKMLYHGLTTLMSVPAEELMVVDSETINTLDNQGFEAVTYFEEKLADGNIRGVIASPSIATGVDFNGVFDVVIYFAGESGDTDTDMQFLFRERNLNIPRYTYYPPRLGTQATKQLNKFKGFGAQQAIAQLVNEEALDFNQEIAGCGNDAQYLELTSNFTTTQATAILGDARAERVAKTCVTSTRTQREPRFDKDGLPLNYAAHGMCARAIKWHQNVEKDTPADKAFDKIWLEENGNFQSQTTQAIAQEELLSAVTGETRWASPEQEKCLKAILANETLTEKQREDLIAEILIDAPKTTRVKNALRNSRIQDTYGKSNINVFTAMSYEKGDHMSQKDMRPISPEVQDFYKHKDRERIAAIKENGEYYGDVTRHLKSLKIQRSIDIKPLDLFNGIRDRLADMDTRKPGEAMAMVERYVQEHCNAIAQMLKSTDAPERKWKAYLGVSCHDEYANAKPKQILRHIAAQYGVTKIMGTRKQGIVKAGMVQMLFDADVGIMTQAIAHWVDEDRQKLEAWRASQLVPC